MLYFRKFWEENTVGKHNDFAGGAYLTSDFTGSEASQTMGLEGRPPQYPSYDLGLPNVTKTGIIKFIDKNKNPIFIFLSDGTKLYLSLDEFNRVKSKPEVGKTIVAVFQRAENDVSDNTSQIASLKCY